MIHKPESTKIFFSGVEGDRFFETAYTQGNCRHMLMSILYVVNKGDAFFERRVNKRPDIRWMLDSGGHSFRKEGYCPKWPDIAWFDDFAKQYHDWLGANKHLIDLAVNLDIDNVVGMEKMLEYDNDIFRPIEREGVPICYVWHEEYGYDFWLKMCREHEYVGLPGHLDEAVYHKMLRPAMMNGCRVHGFACTKASILGKVPFATVDSTSWKAGERFGQTFVYEGGKLHTYDKSHKEQRKRYKARWVAIGVDWDNLEKDKAEEITKVCAYAWGEYQKHLDIMSGKLAYWLKTSRMIDALGDLKKVSLETIKTLLEEVQAPLNPTSEAGARDMIAEVRGILARDPAVVMALTDDDLAWWIKEIGAEPENTQRVEFEAAIRQKLYTWFYRLNVQESKGREAPEDVSPVLSTKDRDGDIPDAPTTTVDLPSDDTPDGGSFLALGYETTPEDNHRETTQESVSRHDDPTCAATTEPTEVVINTDFVDRLESRIQRAKASLGVEIIFEQHKLRHKVETLKRLKMRLKQQRKYQQQIRSMAEELTSIADTLPESVVREMEEAALAAFEQWQAIDGDIEAREKAEYQKTLAQRPQNVAMKERASEIGRMGGAPKGNQNARKHGLASKKMPNLACDNCPHIQVCPQYRAGFVCAFLREFEAQLLVEEGESPEMSAVKSILIEQVKRAKRALLFETFEGGLINKDTSRVLRDVTHAAHLLHQMKNPVVKLAPGVQQPSAPAGDSILGKLFGDMLQGKAKDAQVEAVS
jgi:hypothetical protein